MDIVSIISSVSKIAVVAFTITLGVVIFEVFTLLKKNRDKQGVVQDHVDIPDFNQDLQAEQHFTQLPNAQAAPAVAEPQGLSKPVLLGIGIVTILLMTGIGMWIFTKNQVKSTKRTKDVSPIADASLTPTKGPKPSATAFPTQKLLPTLSVSPTAPLTPMVSITGQASPTGTQEKGGSMITVTPTSMMASATATVKPTTTLPQAGTFQSSLVIALVSVALIYLALLL